MEMFLFKPDNYKEWSDSAIKKIIKVVDSCISDDHLDSAKQMIDHFILMLALNETYSEETVQDISKQLYLYLNIKKSNI
jgi:hypothetical protein